MIRALVRNARASAAVEFALVAPTFLMFIFLLLDGGRMLFAKQSLNEVTAATARCYAIKATGCDTDSAAQGWAVAHALARNNLAVVASNVVIATTCSGMTNVAQVSISTAFKRGAMTLLPQSIAPSTLTSVACFPIAS